MRTLYNKILGKIDYLKRAIYFFYCKSDGRQNSIENDKFIFFEINDASQLFDIDSNKQQEYKKRIEDGHIFCCLKAGDCLSSYGWINPTSSHFFGELNLKTNYPNTIEVLYDFYTYEDYRGQGLYPLLLQKICLRNNKTKIGYALSDNLSSMKGLKKADFKLLAIIKGYNKGRLERLLKKI